MKRFLSISFFFCLCFNGLAQFYTGSNMSFGRKRVQFETFFWSYHRYEGFDVYFNRNGKNLALYTASFVQTQLQTIEERVGEPVSDKMQFIIFNRLTDYKQSNIGYLEEENSNSGGITQLNKNKIFLFFNGDYVDFERQIREGITEILVRQILFGTSIAAQVKNNTAMSVPDWFLFGLTSYLSTSWNTRLDDMMRDAVLSKKFRYIATLEGEEAKMAGHSLFRYIAENHGDATVLRILRVTAAQRKVENGLKYALNISYKQLMRDWQKFYAENTDFEGDTEVINTKSALRRVRQKDRKHYQFRASSDGKHLAYISNEVGRARVHIQNAQSGQNQVVMSIGYAINDRPDFSYPALDWHPNGEILAIAAENQGITSLFLYNVKTKRADWLNLENLDKILSINFSPNGRMLALAAVQNGQSDIFSFNMGTRVLTPLTRDLYDDANPRFLKNGTQIMFSSNRPSDTLERNKRFAKAPLLNPNHNIFIYDVESENPLLMRVTDDSLTHFSNPAEYENGVFTFLTDESGVNNRAIGLIDSTIASIDTAIHWRYTTDYRTVTNLNRSIQEQSATMLNTYEDAGFEQTEITEIIAYDNKNRLIRESAKPSQSIETQTPAKTKFRISQEKKRKKDLENAVISDSLKAIDSLKISGKRRLRQATTNDMVNELSDLIWNVTLPNLSPTDSLNTDSIREQIRNRAIQILGLARDSGDTVRLTINPQQRNYNVEYFINETTSQVGLSFLNSSYQAFSSVGSPIYLNAGMNAFLKVSATDLMENHRIIAGYRLSFDFSNNEYLLSYENLENRTGKQYVFHRQALTQNNGIDSYKQISHNAYFIVKHPLTEVLLVKGTLFGRTDKTVIKAIDDWSLRQPDEWSLWSGLKGELIYDHSRMIGKNIPLGSRGKIFGEYYQSLTEEETSMFVIGADYRHYTRLFRTFIWANRVAGSTSFGKRKLIYYMGGVDDWLLPKFNQNIEVDTEQNYAFQTLATSMRGFTQNIRNGNTFVVASSELRLPIMQVLFARPIGGQWLQNLQFVAFVDAGSAWVGWNPWDKNNAIYKKKITSGDLTITVQKELSPFVAGIGYGLRTSIGGYFIRVDRGNGVENGILNRRVWHIAFGFDF